MTKDKAESLGRLYEKLYNCPPRMKDFTTDSVFCDSKFIISLYGCWSNYLLALGYKKDCRNRVIKPGPLPKPEYRIRRIGPKLKKHLFSLELSDSDKSFIKGCLRFQDRSSQLTEAQFNKILYIQYNKYVKEITNV